MAKQNINVGTAANDKKGDSLRAAFVKVNANFTELYTELGLVVDANLNLGAFEFAGSTLSTTDSTAIVIDQATTITSNLSVGGDIVPQTANGGDLGSSTLPWRSLYVSNNTIYIGGTAVGLDANGNLTTGGTIVGSTPAWANITGKPTFATVATTGAYADLTGKPTIPTLVSQLSNDSGFLTSVSNIQSESDVSIQVNLTDSTTRIWRFGEDGSLTLPSVGKINNGEYDWTFGTDGELALPNNGKIASGVSTAQVGSTTTIALNDQGTDQAYDVTYLGINWTGNEAVFTTYAAGSTITFANGDVRTINDIQKNEVYGFPGEFVIDIYWSASRANLTAFPITLKTFNYAAAYTAPEWQFGTDGVLTLPAGSSRVTSYGQITMETDNGGSGIYLNATGVNLVYANTNVTLRSNSTGTTNDWTFGTDGSLTIPGDIRSDSNINIDINLADSTLRRWSFGEDGNLETPGGVQVAGILKIDDGVHEQFQVKVDATGVVTHDCSSGHIFYHTSPDANWTANFTNLNLSATYATSITLIIVQGATGYYPSAVQIAGSAQTINWQGNVNPTVSTSRTDVVTFSVINNAGTYTVLGQLTGF